MAQSISFDLSTEKTAILARLYLSGDTFPNDKDYRKIFDKVINRVRKKYSSGNYNRLVLSLADIPYLQSVAISGLLRLRSELEKQGIELRLVELKEEIVNVLKIMHLDNYLNVFPSKEDALA